MSDERLRRLDELSDRLAASLEDLRLSRAERGALRDWLEAEGRGIAPEEVRRRAVELARLAAADAPTGAEAVLAIDWLEGVLKLLDVNPDDAPATPSGSLAEVHFSPGMSCLNRIVSLIRNARKSADICVFTITDDRITGPIIEAHRRGLAIRLITDNEKAEDEGSDIGRIDQAGVKVRVDRSPYHMHHKFAVFDGAIVLSGSYNWTRGAANDNEENLIVSDDPRLVGPYARAFQQLWDHLE